MTAVEKKATARAVIEQIAGNVGMGLWTCNRGKASK
jgi:hypothetical protein